MGQCVEECLYERRRRFFWRKNTKQKNICVWFPFQGWKCNNYFGTWLTSYVESKTDSDQILSSYSSSPKKESSGSYVEEASETKRLIEEIKQL